MRVIKIAPQKFKKNYCTVFLEGETPLRMHKEVARQIREGDDLDDKKLEELKFASSVKEAEEHALLILNYRALSEEELRDRLHRKGFGVKVADRIALDFKEKKLIEDGKFARDFAEGRIRNRGFGRERVKQDLIRRGVPKEAAENAVEEAQSSGDYPSEEERAYVALLKRARQMRETDFRTLYRRVFGYLLRRGFSQELIEKAFHRYKAGEPGGHA